MVDGRGRVPGHDARPARTACRTPRQRHATTGAPTACAEQPGRARHRVRPDRRDQYRDGVAAGHGLPARPQRAQPVLRDRLRRARLAEPAHPLVRPPARPGAAAPAGRLARRRRRTPSMQDPVRGEAPARAASRSSATSTTSSRARPTRSPSTGTRRCPGSRPSSPTRARAAPAAAACTVPYSPCWTSAACGYLNLGVVPRQQHRRHRHARELRRPRELRKIQQSLARTCRAPPTLRRRRRPAPAAPPRRQSPAPAARRPTARSPRSKSLGRQRLRARARPPLRTCRTAPRCVPSALRRSASACVKRRPSGRRQYHRAGVAARGTNRLHRPKERLRLQHHARPAAKRHVVHDAMPIGRVVPKVVHRDVEHSALDRAPDHPLAQRRLHHRGEDGDDVDFHRGASPRRPPSPSLAGAPAPLRSRPHSLRAVRRHCQFSRAPPADRPRCATPPDRRDTDVSRHRDQHLSALPLHHESASLHRSFDRA